MTLDAHFASHGPFGPTILGCLGLLSILAGPFIVSALVVISFRRPEPSRWWVTGILILFAVHLAYFVVTSGVPKHRWGIWELWQAVGAIAVLGTPVALAWEAYKWQCHNRNQAERRRFQEEDEDDNPRKTK